MRTIFKNDGAGVFTTRATLWVSAAVLMWGSLRGENSLEKYLELSSSLDILEDTVQGLKGDIDSLNKEINRIEKSPVYAKKVLRDKYHVTEENEVIIFFAD